MTDFRDTLRGIVAMLVSCLFFIINDTLVKLAADELPLGEVLFIRSLLATAIIFAYVWYLGLAGSILGHMSRFIAARSITEGVSTVVYLSGLLHLPIANSSAIAQGSPLAMTAAGALVLGEKVGWRRWLTIVVGFIGILVIVRPGVDGFNAWALLPLSTVFLVTFRELMTRFIPRATPSVVVMFVTSVAVTVICGMLAATETWEALSMRSTLLIVAAALASILGMQGSIISMRHGDVSVVAQFRYSFIPFAVLIGWFIWGDVPDLVTLAGILIVVGSGIYIFYRERLNHQEIAARTEPNV